MQDKRYADLDHYLKNMQWQEADEETYRLMIAAAGKKEGQWFKREDFFNLPCGSLKAIDDLWLGYSDRKFGFSIQKELYLACGGIPDGKYYREAWRKFCETNGWIVKMDFWSELLFGPINCSPKGHRTIAVNFDVASPKGHLPTYQMKTHAYYLVYSPMFSPNSSCCDAFSSLISRFVTCLG